MGCTSHPFRAMVFSNSHYPHPFSRILNDSISFVTISDDKETTMFLKLRALAIQTPLSDEKIDE